MTDTLPDGYTPHFRSSDLTDPWEPLYSEKLDDRVRIGLRVGEAHCNSRGFAHGGLISALADNAMGLSCATVIAERGETLRGLVTTNLNMDFMSAAKTGQWLVFDTDYTKCGRTLCFARCLVLADGEPIAKGSATFKRS